MNDNQRAGAAAAIGPVRRLNRAHPEGVGMRTLIPAVGPIAVLAAWMLAAPAAGGESPAPAGPAGPKGFSERIADAALGAGTPAASAVEAGTPAPLELFLKGGWLMAPIVLMSLLATAVGVERLFGLRRARVTPRLLERGLRQLAEVGDFEPRTAYRLCKEYPSAMATVVAAMVAKAGRPHAEVAEAAASATQREADALHANVRTLNLTSAVTPLMGLLGTVGGMIVAFFQTQALPDGSNKSDALAEGIYLALVTTFAGLAVAIPAAVLAHYLEGRILRVVRRIELLVEELLPRLERHEGGPRIDLSEIDAMDPAAPPPPAATWSEPGSGFPAPAPFDSPAARGDAPPIQPGPPAPHNALTGASAPRPAPA